MLNFRDSSRKWIQFGGFIVAGAANTGITFAVYESLILFIDYRLAYAVAFAVGLVAATIMNVHLVFGKTLTRRSFWLYGPYYCLYGGLSLMVATIAVDNFEVPKAWAPVPVLLLLTGPHFLASRYLVAAAEKKA